ncbi:hypothetical protein R5W23_003644 [Gemmata sp. JC673]|uniref:CopG-like ribbon-helix-helix domain-containing protein n=1 Tax=Gemmata algarum TaxID=2975278 RepID=A0ABU5F3Q5_9BACT|nr:hypothetical protein [Gemmata algarum]MDY3562195.1 hypothetical protein [Gemmata algarum]
MPVPSRVELRVDTTLELRRELKRRALDEDKPLVQLVNELLWAAVKSPPAEQKS